MAAFDSTIVRVKTDTVLIGHGEVCPLGPAYLPAYAAGVRAGLAELAPHLIGDDPLHLESLNHRMDALLKGHPMDVVNIWPTARRRSFCSPARISTVTSL